LPVIVLPCSLSSVVSTTVDRLVFALVRKSFNDCSSPARERTCVE
jgi:hypothetical protein